MFLPVQFDSDLPVCPVRCRICDRRFDKTEERVAFIDFEMVGTASDAKDAEAPLFSVVLQATNELACRDCYDTIVAASRGSRLKNPFSEGTREHRLYQRRLDRMKAWQDRMTKADRDRENQIGGAL